MLDTIIIALDTDHKYYINKALIIHIKLTLLNALTGLTNFDVIESVCKKNSEQCRFFDFFVECGQTKGFILNLIKIIGNC